MLEPSRRLTVHLLLAVLVGGTLYDMARDREHWPLSSYPMFANAEREHRFSLLRVVGVVESPTATLTAFPLLDVRYIKPFDQALLSLALDRNYHDLARRPLVPALLRDVLRRYDAMRVAGAHDGPPLKSLKLYEMSWTLDPLGRNVDTPDTKVLLAEVTE